MEWVRKNRNSGFTLIEVMVSMLVILIIAIGVASYMYSCAWNAKRADVRITATRVGQFLLETWKITGHHIFDASGNIIGWSWNVSDFDPTDPDFNSTLPDSFGGITVDLGGVGTELGDYGIQIDGVVYFATLLFDNNQPAMLNARVAWNKNYSSATLESDFMYVDVTSSAIY